jgi:hypothetical protein
MNRSGFVLIFFLLIVGGLIFLLSRDGEKELLWYPTYNYERGENPYDLDVIINLLKNDVGHDSFERLSAPFSSYTTPKKKALYFSTQSNFYPDSTQTAALLNFVEKGNNAFVSAESFGSNFIDQLLFADDGNRCYPNTNLTSYYKISRDSCVLMLSPSGPQVSVEIPNTSNSWQPFRTINLICDKASRFDVVGTTGDGLVNIIRLQVGAGHIYVHSAPVAFTNIVMLDSQAFRYADALFKNIVFDKIYWDELNFIQVNESGESKTEEFDQSAFVHIFSNRSLRFAFFTILISVLIFVLLAMRRYQPAIPVVEAPTNTSISFSKTIARLYWLNPNHKKMAEKKVKFFLSEIRLRYGIETKKIDEEFKEKLRRKSGVDKRQINRLFDAYIVVNKSQNIHADLLKQISDSISYIRKSWK